jgi:hypothetical protein
VVAKLDVDGPTNEFRAHHHVIARGRSGGFRVLSRLEKLLLGGDITRRQFQAGQAFANAYLLAYESGSSSLAGSEVRGHFDQTGGRHLAAIRYAEARVKLDGSEAASPGSNSSLLLSMLIDNEGFNRIGRWLGITDKPAKRRIVGWLDVLAEHYETHH